ncbi:hypothetical protein FA15DRAFT_665648 [Coprinopsis marcescibilis]|uniref:Aerobactin siderophore biosynthesis IucA/IucC N-terminal domain-containing protein n=1 Tax=Coprinopsis marcescibilis TaxID=230819 RepID=A0A5C3L6K9_COPMA|nr:hypothetical protein FA15DRAFT_665648 [Coprinopsis marcescibilis]
MSSGSGLLPEKHAAFAVLSRLISCLVTEALMPAFYVPVSSSKFSPGVMIIMSLNHSKGNGRPSPPFGPDHIFAIIPLRTRPVLKQATDIGTPIGLVDPLDMTPYIYECVKKGAECGSGDETSERLLSLLNTPTWQLASCSLRQTEDPALIWHKFANSVGIKDPMKATIATELLNSMKYQYKAYLNPPPCPTLQSSSIEWEQSLVAGHPTHPMHRARLLPLGSIDYDWYRPLIRFVQVPKNRLDIRGAFKGISNSVAKSAAAKSGIELDCSSYVYMPVHELQVPNIKKLFGDLKILPPQVHLKAMAQSSIRTVILPELPGHALKLSVGVKISSALRTISHFTADFGPRFSDIVPKLAIDHSILVVETEPSSAVIRHEDPEVQKHFTAVIRNEYEPKPTENVIVIAALLETDHSNTPTGVPAVVHVFGLDTERKRVEFLDRYIELSCKAVLPALVQNGVAFEAHAQNMLLRVDKSTRQIIGFVLRDLGGLRIHPPTLRKSTGIDFQFLPKHCIATETLQQIYPKFYHTYVHNHIQRLIRLLDLHSSGIGWEILRRHMNAAIPPDHELKKLWLSPSSHAVESKCFMRMRIQDSYRDNIYHPHPNLIQYCPDKKLGRRRESML